MENVAKLVEIESGFVINEPPRPLLVKAVPLGLAGHGPLENTAARGQPGSPVDEATTPLVLAAAMGRLADAEAGY